MYHAGGRIPTAHESAAIVAGLRAKPTGRDTWQARCPAHNDRKPSLSLRLSERGQLLFKCHAGCSQEAVADALRNRGLCFGYRPSASSKSSPHGHSSKHGGDGGQLEKARWLWQRSEPAGGTLVGRYLASRGMPGPVPPSLRFLASRKPDHHPAMIVAFGLPHERRPGEVIMPISRVMGVHLTLLRSNGDGKAGTERDKLMIGPSSGWPIVIAPVNDVGGLAIAEGIEDALSLNRATGLGAWAAGAAGRLGKLAEHVPLDAECVTIVEDDDEAGRRGAYELAEGLVVGGIEVVMLPAQENRMAAA